MYSVPKFSEKIVQGREAEHNSGQGDESVGQKLDSFRIEVAAVVVEPTIHTLVNLWGSFELIWIWTFIWDVFGKDKVSPSVEKSEKQAKDERQKKLPGIPMFGMSPVL